MADFASMMGGGPGTVPTADADPTQALVYYYDEGDVFLELGAQGDQFVGTGNLGSVTVLGGTGDDTLLGGEGDDDLFGGSGNDSIFGDKGDDSLVGNRGDDTIAAGSGDDTVLGGTGDDEIIGGDGANELSGGAGDDTIMGAAGDDSMFGGTGDDMLDGGDGDDAINGGAGDDSITGGAGDDLLAGGPGEDSFYFFDGFGDDVISDLRDGDSIVLQANLNGSGLASPADLLNPSVASITGGVEAGVKFTLISIGGDTIRLQNVDVNDFSANLNSFVKIA
jgi:Ca2+-binding RTX toxin-like protein